VHANVLLVPAGQCGAVLSGGDTAWRAEVAHAAAAFAASSCCRLTTTSSPRAPCHVLPMQLQQARESVQATMDAECERPVAATESQRRACGCCMWAVVVVGKRARRFKPPASLTRDSDPPCSPPFLPAAAPGWVDRFKGEARKGCDILVQVRRAGGDVGGGAGGGANER